MSHAAAAMAKKLKCPGFCGPFLGESPAAWDPASSELEGYPSIHQQNVFLDAAKDQSFDRVRELIEHNPAYINVQPNGRWSALHQFAYVGDVRAVQFLLDRRANLDAKASTGETVAEVAHDNVVALFVQHVEAREKAEAEARARARAAEERKKAAEQAIATKTAKSDAESGPVSVQRSFGAQSSRGLPTPPTFIGVFYKKPQFAAHAERVFAELLQREAKMVDDWVVFYHLYNTPALVYEVQAAIASVLFKFGNAYGSLPRLLKHPFLDLPDADAVMKAFPRWPDKDHNAEFKGVGICCTTSLVSEDPEATPTEFFLNGYGVATVGVEVLEKLLRDCGADLDGGNVPELARRAVELSRKHGLPQSTGKDPEGHLLQIFVNRTRVDRFAYASLPHGVPDDSRRPLSQHLAGAGPISGQARLIVNPSVFMRANSVRMHTCSASEEFHHARPTFQKELRALLSPVLGSPAVRERAARGIYAGELPAWWRDLGP